MKKFLKLIPLALCSAVCALGAAGCGTTTYVSVADPTPYEFTKKEWPKAKVDSDMTIDGKFDEARWKNAHWFTGYDVANAKMYAKMSYTVTFGREGVYFGFIVEEEGTTIYVNPARGTSCNSSVEMYLAPVDAASYSIYEYEITMVPGFLSHRIYSPKYDGYVPAEAVEDIRPILGSILLGGEANTEECYGYQHEMFIPWGYLEKYGYDVSDPDTLLLAVNPAHIFSLSYEGLDNNKNRIWSNNLGYCYGAQWRTPATYLKFGKDGIVAFDYDVKITGNGTVEEVNGFNCIPIGKSATFEVEAASGATLKSVKVDGNEVSVDSYGRFTVSNPSHDVEIEVEFE